METLKHDDQTHDPMETNAKGQFRLNPSGLPLTGWHKTRIGAHEEFRLKRKRDRKGAKS